MSYCFSSASLSLISHIDRAGRADLSADLLAGQIRLGLDRGVIRPHHDCLVGIEVRIREVVGLLAVIGDGDRGEDGVVCAPVQAGEDAVPGRVLDLDFDPLILGDGLDQVNVEADDGLAGVHELHGRPRGVAGDHELPGRGRRGRLRGSGRLGRLSWLRRFSSLGGCGGRRRSGRRRTTAGCQHAQQQYCHGKQADQFEMLHLVCSS